ncbi:MAG: hypothetical protein ACJ787_19825, partial [Myxococcales bacterium]
MALALDAMGGDLAPAATVEGALRTHRERGLEVILVGDEARLRVQLRRLGAGAGELRIHHASEVVDVTPLHLVQFALPGEVHARRVLAVTRPSIGIVASGEKGTDLARAAAS